MAGRSLPVIAIFSIDMTRLSLTTLLLFLVATVPRAEESATPQTGEFELSYTVTELVGDRSAQSVAEVVATDEPIEFSVYVPEAYDPANPPGVMVYISPTSSGDVPDSWKPVLDSHNMIWIGAHKSGNREIVARRVLFSMLAPTVIDRHYRRDNERIYVSGLSGGGKVASRVATTQPGLFKGAMYNCGVDPIPFDDPQLLEPVRANHFVFVTGELDQARRPTKKVHRAYGKAGVENTLLLDIRDMTHRNPDSRYFRETIEFLDSRSTDNQST